MKNHKFTDIQRNMLVQMYYEKLYICCYMSPVSHDGFTIFTTNNSDCVRVHNTLSIVSVRALIRHKYIEEDSIHIAHLGQYPSNVYSYFMQNELSVFAYFKLSQKAIDKLKFERCI